MADPRFKYHTAEELQAAIDEIFADADARERPKTIAGLSWRLGFADRRSFYDYEKKGNELSRVLTRARHQIEAEVEEGMLQKGHAGQIFWLKNKDSDRWKDKQELEVSTDPSKMSEAELDARLAAADDEIERLTQQLSALPPPEKT